MCTPTINPSIELSFPSEFGYEKVAREAVAAFARRFGFEPERIEDLKTALGEACVNAIEHGNQRAPGLRVNVNCSCDDQALKVEICDHGVQEYQQHSGPVSIEKKLGGTVPLRGMGLMIISQLVDESGFDNCPNGGNLFWFSIKRHLHSSAAKEQGSYDVRR